MQNYGIGTQKDIMCAKISTGNAPQLIWPIYQNWPIIWHTLAMIYHFMSIVHEHIYILFNPNKPGLFELVSTKGKWGQLDLKSCSHVSYSLATVSTLIGS